MIFSAIGGIDLCRPELEQGIRHLPFTAERLPEPLAFDVDVLACCSDWPKWSLVAVFFDANVPGVMLTHCPPTYTGTHRARWH